MAQTERRIIISGEDGGFSDLIDQLRDMGTEMFEQLTDRADQYLQKLTEIAERAQNMPSGGSGDPFNESLLGNQGDRDGIAADFQRIFDIISQGFASAVRGGTQLTQTIGYSQNVLGDIGTMAARTANVPLGWIPFWEEFQEESLNAAADLFSMYSGAGQPYRQSMSEFSRIVGRSGQFQFDSKFGMDSMEATNYGSRLYKAMGTNRMPMSELARLLSVEHGVGMDRGELFQFAPVLSRGLSSSLGKVFNDALAKMGQEGFLGDIPRLSREIRNLGSYIQEESRVRSDFSGNRSLLLQSSLRGMGGAFADARQQELFMGLHRGLQSPPNQFWRAMQLESIIGNDPSIGFDPVGLTKARARMSRGIFGEGMLEGVLDQIRGMTADNELRQVLLVNRFQNLLPYFGGDELSKLVSDDSDGAFALGSEEQIKARLRSLGIKEGVETSSALSTRGAVDEVLQEAAKIRTAIQQNGSQVIEKFIPVLNGMTDTLMGLNELLGNLFRN